MTGTIISNNSMTSATIPISIGTKVEIIAIVGNLYYVKGIISGYSNSSNNIFIETFVPKRCVIIDSNSTY